MRKISPFPSESATHAAVAVWDGDKLTIFDKSQEVYNVRKHLASSFNIPETNVQVISPYVGGAGARRAVHRGESRS